jgi:alpha-glucosidase
MGKLNQAVGDVVQLDKTEEGIDCVLSNGLARISVFSDQTVRVRVTNQSSWNRDFSYAVIAKPNQTDYQIVDSPLSCQILLANFSIDIQKKPFRVNFKTLAGQWINKENDSFGVSYLGEQVLRYMDIQDNERFIGLGEKVGPLDRRGQSYENWNSDKFAYTVETDPLYLSTPFYIGLHNGLSYGLFLDNSHKSLFNFGASNNRFAFFGADGGEMNYYFFHGPSVSSIIGAYSELTGKMAMPPKWALGLQQCRYSYYPDSEVLNVAKQYRDRKIPLDVLYLDIHYMEDYKLFTFHPQRFPHPVEMNETLMQQGIHTVCIVDPGIKVEKGYEAYEDGLHKDVFVKYPDGVPFSAEVWPGWSHFPDFTSEKGRNWWGEKLSFLDQAGISGFWNDMNEPACWGQRPPDLIEFDLDGEKTSHKEAHNVYGMQMVRATREGIEKVRQGKRTFILTRAGFSGIQRYSALWTGDNVASDEHMLLGAKLLNSMGLAGLPFTGCDIGGFVGEPSPALFCKWLQLGVFSPMFRLHSMINTRDAEPWSFGEQVEEISRNFINLRYKLLPYIYSSFKESSETGLPMVRSLAINHPENKEVFFPEFEAQYYFGPSLLVCPVDSRQHFSKLYFPEGKWYELFTDTTIEGPTQAAWEVPLRKYPVFVKAGALIPIQKVVQHTGEPVGDILELHVYSGADGRFDWYEDDGESLNYQDGTYNLIRFSWSDSQTAFSLEMLHQEFISTYKQIRLHLHGYAGSTCQFNGQTLDLQSQSYRFIEPITRFDPFGKVGEEDACEVKVGLLHL